MLLLFFLMWVIFNGKVTLEIVLLGIVISILMYGFLCRFMDFSWRKDVRICRCIFYIFQYAFVLLWEILKANVATTRLILSFRKHHPVIIRFRSGLETKMARVVLANSITLTPGTITVSLEEGEYLVHCLDKSMAEGMSDSVLVRLLKRMENTGMSQRADRKVIK